MSRILAKLFVRSLSPKRLALVNFVDRAISFAVYYLTANLFRIDPLTGVIAGLAVEAVVVYFALRAIEKKGLLSNLTGESNED